MTQYPEKNLPMREVFFHNVTLVGHTKVKAILCYKINTAKRSTWVRQPIEFDLCNAKILAHRFHEFAADLDKQLTEFKITLRGDDQ